MGDPKLGIIFKVTLSLESPLFVGEGLALLMGALEECTKPLSINSRMLICLQALGLGLNSPSSQDRFEDLRALASKSPLMHLGLFCGVLT